MDPVGESVSYETINLPDDILIILAKYYVEEKDGLSLSLSGASESFASFYGRNRKILVISQCYFLALSPWNRFFQKHITPSAITLFDASNCYWLPAVAFFSSIKQMVNVEELNIQGTQMSLGHLPQVFQDCHKIRKLSFTLAEKNLDRYQDYVMEEVALDWIKDGFTRITNLKIFTYALNECYAESWLVTLGVLKWCRDCVDLVIQIASSEPNITALPYDEFNRIRVKIQARLLPHLGWMRQLKSLVILRSNSPPRCLQDQIMSNLLFWLLEEQDEPVHSLQRFWINDDDLLTEYNEDLMTGPSVKSLTLNETDGLQFDLLDERYRHLEHVAGLQFRRFDHLPDLKYFRGMCAFDDEEFNNFCQSHSILEELHFDTSGIWYDEEEAGHFFGDGDWALPLLKVLVFYYNDVIIQADVDHLVKACPNIKELYLKSTSKKPRDRTESIHFFSSIRFQHLVSLGMNEPHLFDGSYLPLVIKQCPKLERIHFEAGLIEPSFFSHLAESLPAASNLRDLRLKWKINREIDSSHVVLLLKALLKCSSHYERLVLIYETDEYQSNLTIQTDFILSFASKMTHLVALCLVGFHFVPNEVDVLKQRFTEEILPFRPAFWYHVGEHLPKGNDTTVPRIHYNEIVSPVDPFYAPPRF